MGERRLMEQAVQEKEEFGRILRVQKETTMAEETVKYARVDKLKMHQEELTTQILMNGEVRKKNRMDFLNEGSRAAADGGRSPEARGHQGQQAGHPAHAGRAGEIHRRPLQQEVLVSWWRRASLRSKLFCLALGSRGCVCLCGLEGAE